jgi:hypothetical protein
LNITEAVRIALKQGKFFTRPEYKNSFKTLPTNTDECCVLYDANGKKLAPRWEPDASDLMADDYIVVD